MSARKLEASLRLRYRPCNPPFFSFVACAWLAIAYLLPSEVGTESYHTGFSGRTMPRPNEHLPGISVGLTSPLTSRSLLKDINSATIMRIPKKPAGIRFWDIHVFNIEIKPSHPVIIEIGTESSFSNRSFTRLPQQKSPT